MARSKMRELEDDFERIVRTREGDLPGRRKGDEYLSRTHALYHGDPAPWALTPKIFDKDMTALLKEAAERMYVIMDKVTRAFCSDASVRAWFRMDSAFAELCAMDAGYDCQIPLARVDIFLDEDSGSYSFCELNTDGSAGMVVTDAICQAVRMTPSFEEFASDHPGFRQYDLCGSWIDALFETYAEWKRVHPRRTEDSIRSDDGSRVGKRLYTPQSKIYPASVAIVDYSEGIDLEDAAHFVDLMRRRGVAARFADVRDLRIAEDESGARRLCDAVGPIDCVWRRAVTGELWDKPCDGRSALIEAAQEGLACIVGGFRTWPCATKTVFAFLWSRAGQSLLSPEEQSFVREHVPYTEILDESTQLSRFAEKDRWIVKPCGGYNAVGVVAGLDVAEREWPQVLARAAAAGAIVQEYAQQYQTPCLRGTLVDGPHRGEAPKGLVDDLGFAPASNAHVR